MILLHFLNKINNPFLHQPNKQSPKPSQINLIKNVKNHLLLKKLKNTESAHHCPCVSRVAFRILVLANSERVKMERTNKLSRFFRRPVADLQVAGVLPAHRQPYCVCLARGESRRSLVAFLSSKRSGHTNR